MKRTWAILLAVVMAVPASAAAESKRFTEQDTELLRQYAGKLPVGSVVKVRLRDGGKLKGILMAADQDGVVVKPKTRIPEPERRVPFTNLEMLEVDTPGGSNAAKAAAIGVASGVGTFLGLLLVIAAAFHD